MQPEYLPFILEDVAVILSSFYSKKLTSHLKNYLRLNRTADIKRRTSIPTTFELGKERERERKREKVSFFSFILENYSVFVHFTA